MANMNFKAAAAVAALSALFLAGCSDGAKTEPSTAAASSSAAAPAKTEPSAAPSAAENTASAAQPGRGCLQVTAVHPYNLKDMRFDEAAQALAHATGCAVRYTDQELSAMKIAPVVGTMSIKDAIAAALDAPAASGKPKCILAHTVKGKGVSFMEDQVGWHGKAPNEEQRQQALKELED